MNTSNRRLSMAMIAVAMAAFVVLVAATSAQAQLTVTNNSGCDVLLTLVDAGGNLSGPYLVPSGVATVIPTPPGYDPVAVEDINGRTRNFVGKGGCTGCIPLPAQGGASDVCCVNVCHPPGTDVITITACSPC